MMSSLTSLQSALRQASSRPLRGLALDTRNIDQELVTLRRWIGDRGSAKPPQDAVMSALQRFYRDQKLHNGSQTRLVCFGCITALPGGQKLIEDGERFSALLRSVDEWRPRPRAFRLCYRGLLYAYFGYYPEVARSAGQQNWHQLRNYLRDRAPNTVTDGRLPTWVNSLQQNMQLLGDDPGRVYGPALLAGESAEFDSAREALDIHEDSWLIRLLVLGQIEAAAHANDQGFIGHLPKLLPLLEKHPLAVNDGLTRLLNRYEACASPIAHAALRDFAVARWGNPWLTLNKAKWSQVSAETRAMVADWLKLDLIRQFFSLLAADGSNDTRRLKFWERYHDSIDDMYFALGNFARWHRGQDFLNIREKMAGRLLTLHSAGAPENNAFIMCIGDYVVVEFGIKGNACFIFERDSLPFALEGSIAGNGAALKHESYVERLLHQDASFEKWEAKFQRALVSRMRVRPSVPQAGDPSISRMPVPGGGAPRLVRPASSATGARPESQKMGHRESFSMRALAQFCSARRLRTEDFRDRNGNLWVLTDDRDRSLNGQLRAWGFSFKAGKGWWRK